MILRREMPADYNEVFELIKAAFEHGGNGDEEYLVARLRGSACFVPELSMVAEHDGKIVGQIMLTRVKIGDYTSLALAPLSVLPGLQKSGIGTALITAAHKKARALGYSSVIVLGHPEYYPKFGYKKAGEFGITAPFEVADEAFMAVQLCENGLQGVSGTVRYPAEFGI